MDTPPSYEVALKMIDEANDSEELSKAIELAADAMLRENGIPVEEIE